MLIVPDGVGITNCRAAAGANNKAENWQQNVDEQEIACVDYEQNEMLNHKKSRCSTRSITNRGLVLLDTAT